MSETCGCGWDGTGDHPCHGSAYSCRKPATSRLYVPTMRASLAGLQMKLSVGETFACDECWERTKPEREAVLSRKGA